MRNIHNSFNQGFSLVEVLVASLILAIGLLAVATMIARSTIQDSRAYYMTRASMIMEAFIEETVRVQYDRDDLKDLNNTTSSTVIDGVTYTKDCTIQKNTPIKNATEMTCEINWNNKGLQASTTYVYVFTPKY